MINGDEKQEVTYKIDIHQLQSFIKHSRLLGHDFKLIAVTFLSTTVLQARL